MRVSLCACVCVCVFVSMSMPAPVPARACAPARIKKRRGAGAGAGAGAVACCGVSWHAVPCHAAAPCLAMPWRACVHACACAHITASSWCIATLTYELPFDV